MAADDLEFFPTPAWQTHVLLAYARIRGTVLEPCAGDGAIADILERQPGVAVLVRNDLVVRARPADLFSEPEHVTSRLTQTSHDATDARFWYEHQYNHGVPLRLDWVVTNPPFSRAHEILVHAQQHADQVAMLLRLSYLEPPRTEPARQRAVWLAQHPPDHLIFMPRASYTTSAGGSRNDQIGTMWAIWNRAYRPMTTKLDWVLDDQPFVQAAQLGRGEAVAGRT